MFSEALRKWSKCKRGQINVSGAEHSQENQVPCPVWGLGYHKVGVPHPWKAPGPSWMHLEKPGISGGCPCPWIWMGFKVPCNLNYSGILSAANKQMEKIIKKIIKILISHGGSFSGSINSVGSTQVLFLNKPPLLSVMV